MTEIWLLLMALSALALLAWPAAGGRQTSEDLDRGLATLRPMATGPSCLEVTCLAH